jgi:hypothetical protein
LQIASRTWYRILSIVEISAIVIATFVLIVPIQDYALREFKEWLSHPSPETLTAFHNKQQEESQVSIDHRGPFRYPGSSVGLSSVPIASEVKKLARPSTIAKSPPLM